MNWLPIESAPKDGTQILVFIPFVVTPNSSGKKTYAHMPRVTSCFWAYCLVNKMHEYGKRAHDLQDIHGGFWSVDKKGRRPIYARPTHWALFSPPTDIKDA